MRIVRAGRDDLARLVPLFDAYRQFYGQASDPRAGRAFLAARLERGESVVYLALESPAGAGPALGFAQLYPLFSSVRLKPLWLLGDLFVVPGARRRGVGRALLERVRQHAEATGARGLELETAVDNTAAQALYRRAGWRRERDFVRFYINVDD